MTASILPIYIYTLYMSNINMHKYYWKKYYGINVNFPETQTDADVVASYSIKGMRNYAHLQHYLSL